MEINILLSKISTICCFMNTVGYRIAYHYTFLHGCEIVRVALSLCAWLCAAGCDRKVQGLTSRRQSGSLLFVSLLRIFVFYQTPSVGHLKAIKLLSKKIHSVLNCGDDFFLSCWGSPHYDLNSCLQATGNDLSNAEHWPNRNM